MLKSLRQTIIKKLWTSYCASSSQIQCIENALQKNVQSLIIDHFAIIDLPGPHTGIRQLSELFSAIGYEARGKDYLPEKQNDFLWMAEHDAANNDARLVLPQIVVADFRLDRLPPAIKNIIEKYSQQASRLPMEKIMYWLKQLPEQPQLATLLEQSILTYLNGRDWPLPTVNEFYTVHEFNELLAWVLVHGRKPNHFTLSIHLLDSFSNLSEFNQFIESELKLPLNHEGGIIKGGLDAGIAQSSTIGNMETIQLADGTIQLPGRFIEFVWRYPRNTCEKPILWNDFFTGFVAQHADNVIESLYVTE